MLRGIGSVIDIYPTSSVHRFADTLPWKDEDDLRGVWDEVSNDLWKGLFDAAGQQRFNISARRTNDGKIVVTIQLSEDNTASSRELNTSHEKR